MKKFTKCLAVLSSAIMALSTGVVQGSAAFEDKVYDTTITNLDGSLYPIRVYDTMEYMGIIFKMADDTVPTAEELGIDCVISKYDAVNYGTGWLEMIAGNGTGWGVEDVTEPAENQYTVQTEYMMSEEEAEEFAKKLVVRGLVEEAGVWYWHVVTNGHIGVYADSSNSINVFFKNEEDSENFSFDKYPEIKELLKYNEYGDIEASGSRVGFSCYTDSSDYNNAEENTYDYMGLYNDVKALNDILTSKYDEIEKVDLAYQTLYSGGQTSNAVYSVEPKWGDATNDDVINLYDAIEISKYIMNISDIDEDTVLLADINRDGKTNIYDAIEVAKTLM